ncbi:hypothetical protein F511_36568 [Dorcoceras hygrometricum]|uniref:Uncharacterized protein n=1 Tax=Dorcoceras hygrometricum TaxID=472368 RepID=A0A2Z7AC83_9LAMI|nr:hypothetical protein F511_36568 [Dorcoceras hygrometricum]
MVVDSVGIFEMKGQYYTLALTNWFLQALSVIPRESWDDVARRFTMIRCLTADCDDITADIINADPALGFFSTADPDFLYLQLVHVIFFLSFDQHLLSTYDQLLLLSSTTDQTSHFGMRPMLFPPKRPNERLTPTQSDTSHCCSAFDDVTTAEIFNKLG